MTGSRLFRARPGRRNRSTFRTANAYDPFEASGETGMKLWIGAVAALSLAAPIAVAGEADVVDVVISRTGEGVYAFAVSVRHDDTGWDHYADRWEVVAPDGSVLGTRVLLHPHEHEQPFTRSQGGIRIRDDMQTVTVRAHDSVHGLGGAELTVAVPR